MAEFRYILKQSIDSLSKHCQILLFILYITLLLIYFFLF